jgi:hypothetical protein
MATIPTHDESYLLLHRAGWSIGDVQFVTLDGRTCWLVSGTHGNHRLESRSESLDEAWHNAVKMAEQMQLRPTDE